MLYADKFVLTFDEVRMAMGSEEKPFPASTLHALNKTGRGPKFFKNGRRNYVLKSDFEAWLISRSQGVQS